MSLPLSALTSRDAVIAAISECDALGRDAFLARYGYRRSRTCPLFYAGKVYDSKAIVGVAMGKQHGEVLRPGSFSGGTNTVVACLSRLGFESAEAAHPALSLRTGAIYLRKDLLERFGGQIQSGIWTPREFKAIFLFTGGSGETYGYSDGWTKDGVYRYIGEGQSGDMSFDGGNKAVLTHSENKKDLLLFEDLGKGKGVRYVGLFVLADWSFVDAKDRNGLMRKAIAFDLAPAAIAAEAVTAWPVELGGANAVADLGALRKQAYRATLRRDAGKRPAGAAVRTVFDRSEAVRQYVFARAKGKCEACGNGAPFQRVDGTPYLEPHHTQRLADDGLDRPDWVGAICPNCHRRIHSGADGAEWNQLLLATIAKREAELNTMYPSTNEVG